MRFLSVRQSYGGISWSVNTGGRDWRLMSVTTPRSMFMTMNPCRASRLLLLLLLLALSSAAPVFAVSQPRSPAASSIPRGGNGQRPQARGGLANQRGAAGGTTKSTPAAAAVVYGAKPGSARGASIPNEVFNLVKAIVGVGVLSLPAGVAAFGSAPGAIAPALALITAIGLLSAYGFAIIGKVCAYTGGATSYREAWARSVGSRSSWIPVASATCKTFLACLAYSMVLGDTFTGLIGAAPSLPSPTRTPTLLAVTGCILLPLCLKKDLKSLAPFSLLGVCGMAYTALAMTKRYLDGSYEASGSLLSGVAKALQPSFGDEGMASVLHPSSLILVCMLSTAYMAHFNAPKFYLELENNTLPRFNSVVSWSFGISIALMGFITAVGFLTFGKGSNGLILNNYAPSDAWMSLARIAVAVSLVFSYPLAFTGCRDGVLDMLEVPLEKRGSARAHWGTTVGLMSILTTLACMLRNVSFVLAVGGATLGNALTYVYPAIMYRAVVKNQNRKGEGLGVAIATVSGILGVIMGAIGATMAVQNAGK